MKANLKGKVNKKWINSVEWKGGIFSVIGVSEGEDEADQRVGDDADAAEDRQHQPEYDIWKFKALEY